MKRGLQAFTVRDFFKDKAQARETYQKIAAVGYESVQTWAPHFMTEVELKEMLDDCGLVNCSTGSDFETMKAGGAAITEAVKSAQLFNVKYISVGTLPEPYRYSLDGIKRYAHDLNGIAAELKKEGCVLLYHHHALEFYSFGGGINGMDILVNETDPEGVYFMLDTHWLAASGVDPVHWINKVRGRMSIIHFKDYGIVEGAVKIEDVQKCFAEVGEGNINWLPIIQACRDIGVEHVIVEQDTCKGCPFDSIKISYDNLIKLGV